LAIHSIGNIKVNILKVYPIARLCVLSVVGIAYKLVLVVEEYIEGVVL
jgi:hypothetical protein